MTENTASKDREAADDGSALTTLDSPEEQVDLPDELDEIDDETDAFPDAPIDDAPAGGRARGIGAVSGGFGFAGLALAVVSLTTNWTSGVVVSHSQYSTEVGAPSSGLTAQQTLDMYANSWQTQGWWALVFAVAAVLFGAGALIWSNVLHGDRTPGWAKAAATGAVIVGLVGVLLAVLTLTGVFGGHLTAPTTAG
jgi:uncharacterized membrane protein